MNGKTREEQIESLSVVLAGAKKVIKSAQETININQDLITEVSNRLETLKVSREQFDGPHFGRPGDFGPVGIYLKTDFFLHSDGDMRPNTMDARCTPCTGNLFDLMDESKGGGPYVLGLTRADMTLLHYLLSIASLKGVQNISDRDSVIPKIEDCLDRTDAALGIKKG